MDDILGFGLHVERNNSGKIKTISSSMEYLSRDAFFGELVRLSVWQEPFNYWLPLVINEKHAAKSVPILQSAISMIVTYLSCG